MPFSASAIFYFTSSISAKHFTLRTFFIQGNKKSCSGWDQVNREGGAQGSHQFGSKTAVHSVQCGQVCLLVTHHEMGNCVERVFKKKSLKSKAASHNNASWCCCKRLHSASVNFFWRLFQHSCPFPDGWFTTAPAHTVLSVQQFWTKSRMTPCPTLPIYLILPWATFLLFPYMKKILKGKCFIVVKEVKQKTSEALKGIKTDEFKSCFKQGKNSR